MMEPGLHDAEEGDIEFGFKPRMQKEKPAGYRETRAPKFAEHGENKGEKSFAEESKKQVHSEEHIASYYTSNIVQ
ncbi:hypothetical protein MKW94_029905 [Papaver nudicaule]|uniref:Uncharacterized protein n=1 Tax=Papaver nudicaule TaxID=74823 RepID=A0AA41SIT3_PAPNU|nr:hypothetical protein [Papaver nudicaule]